MITYRTLGLKLPEFKKKLYMALILTKPTRNCNSKVKKFTYSHKHSTDIISIKP